MNGAPVLLAGLCLVTLLVALPLSLALRGMLEAHLGHSLTAEAAAAGADYEWWQEFLSQATGLGATFTALDHRLRRGAREPRAPCSTTRRWRRRSPA